MIGKWDKWDGSHEGRKPPSMNRSMRQLGTAYAPGALFTWEGGLGSCRSVAIGTSVLNLAAPTKDAIREQIQEYLESWLTRGMAVNDLGTTVFPPHALVDLRVLRDGRPDITEDKLVFVTAERMGYEPFPLAFVCRRCDLYRSSPSVKQLNRDCGTFSSGCPTRKAGGTCRQEWQQLDAVMVHSSGSVKAVSPERLSWSTTQGEPIPDSSCHACKGKDFRLLRPSGQFASWTFECVTCKATRFVVGQDISTLVMLAEQKEKGVKIDEDVKMDVMSYRASSTHYAQSDQVLVFENSQWLDKLQHARKAELTAFLGTYFGYPGTELDDAEKSRLLTQAGKAKEWEAYQGLRRFVASVPPEVRVTLEASMAVSEATWKREVFTSVERGSEALAGRCENRLQLIRRFDPMRMAVEHKTLLDEKLHSSRKASDGREGCVDVTAPDQFLLTDGLDRDRTIRQIKRTLGVLGFSEMRLVRDLKICDFSFGFTRMASMPIDVREGNKNKPVRLNFFDRIEAGGKNMRLPVYCLEQSNEAFYVRLDEKVVRKWLARNYMDTEVHKAERLGGQLVEKYPAFDRFLTDYKREKSVDRNAYSYVYTLLHTVAHQAIGVMSELSGLDLGSFGEHLFVPDLAFLIYRRGTTMDLGNLSSMWRNHGCPEHGNEVLRKMAAPETLRCGSETICMTLRGGACPDCVMIPENACLTRNELLSRSVLVGRGVPRWDRDDRELVGFYDVSREATGLGA